MPENLAHCLPLSANGISVRNSAIATRCPEDSGADRLSRRLVEIGGPHERCCAGPRVRPLFMLITLRLDCLPGVSESFVPRPLGPEERVDTLTALKAMTIWPAVQYFEEASTGAIEPGKLADFVILSDNPLAVKPEDLITLKVLETIKEGKSVYRDERVHRAPLRLPHRPASPPKVVVCWVPLNVDSHRPQRAHCGRRRMGWPTRPIHRFPSVPARSGTAGGRQERSGRSLSNTKNLSLRAVVGRDRHGGDRSSPEAKRRRRADAP